MKKTVFSGLLAIMLVFGFIGCDNGTKNGNADNSIPNEFHGTWVSLHSGYKETYIIRADSITIKAHSVSGTYVPWDYDVNIDTIENVANSTLGTKDNYPTGYMFNTTVTRTETDNRTLGEKTSFCLFFNDDNQSFCWGRTPNNVFLVFNRQEAIE